MNTSALAASVARTWDTSIVPQLVEYIRIPAKSPHFDPPMGGERPHRARDPPRRGLGAPAAGARPRRSRSCACPAARRCCISTCRARATRTVLLYGHLDKQPEMTGWREGLGPVEAGAARTASSTAAAAPTTATRCSRRSPRSARCRRRASPHARCVGLIETCEESGSYDLPAYLELLAPRMGAVDFVVGLDSGCGDYERLWATTSLRGLAGGTLTVDVLTEGVHSGDASGIVPSSFRIARARARPPRGQRDRARAARGVSRADPRGARAAGAARRRRSWARRRSASIRSPGGTQPMVADHAEALLNRTWRPALSVTGADGFPADRRRRQRAAAAHVAQALAAPAAAGRRRARRRRR